MTKTRIRISCNFNKRVCDYYFGFCQGVLKTNASETTELSSDHSKAVARHTDEYNK